MRGHAVPPHPGIYQVPPPESKPPPRWGTLNWNLIPRVRKFDSKFLFLIKVPTLSRAPPPSGITLIGALCTVYTDAVSFVTASVSMRLRLSFTRRRSSSLSEPVVLNTLSKVERFQNDTVSRSCKWRHRIDLKKVWPEVCWLVK